MNLIQSKINEAKKTKNNLSGLNLSSTFINFSSHYVVVCFRDGTYSILSPSTNAPFLDILMVGKSISNYTDGIKTIVGDEDDTLKHIKRGLSINRGTDVSWEESINLTTMLESRSGFYVTNLDIYIGIVDKIDDTLFHPFCFQHNINHNLDCVVEFDPKTQVNINLQIIDSIHPGVDYYTIINNSIVHLRSESSIIKKAGFYISGLPELENNKSNKARRIDIFSLEQSLEGKAKFKLFRSIAEANTLLNENNTNAHLSKLEITKHETIVQGIKKEVELLQQDNYLLQSKRAKDENEHKDYRIEYEKLVQETKQAYELKMASLKEEAAIKSNHAKSTGEYMKVLAGVITFGVLILKVF